MAITIADGFNVTTGLPIDSRFVVADLTARNALNSLVRYRGLKTFVIADQTTYCLKAGITNGDWVSEGSGGALTPLVDVRAGNGVLTAFTLSVDPGTAENVAAYIDGVRQTPGTDYSISTTTLTFAFAPYNGAVILLVSGGVTTVNVPAIGSVTQASKEIRQVGTTVGAGGIAKSLTCGSYSYSNTAEQDITNLTVTITTLGNPVEIDLIPDETNSTSSVEVYVSSPGFPHGNVNLYRGATYKGKLPIAPHAASGAFRITLPPGVIRFHDHPPAGTHTYKLTANTGSGSTTTINIEKCKLRAYEI